MTFNEYAYFAFVILAPILALILAIWVALMWPHRRLAGARWLIASTLLLIGWLLSNTIELVVRPPHSTLLAAKLTYIFIAASPVAFLLFGIEYTRPALLRKVPPFAFFIVPAVTVGLLFSPLEGWVWAEVRTFPVMDFTAMCVTRRGLWFWVHTLYSYAAILTAWGLLVRVYWKQRGTPGRGSKLILTGVLAALGTNALYLSNVLPTTKDFTPISLAVADLFIILGVLREYLFNLRPLAALTVSDNLDDGIFLFNTEELVIDVNPAGERLLHKPRQQLLGQRGCTLLCNDAPDECPQRYGLMQRDVTYQQNGSRLHFELKCQPLFSGNGVYLGRVASLRDISRRVAYERRLIEQSRRIRKLYLASHHLLYPLHPQDIIHNIVHDAHRLLDFVQQTVWYPLDAHMPVETISTAKGDPPPLPSHNLNTLPDIITVQGRRVYLQPVATPERVFGVLGFYLPAEAFLSADEQNLLHNYALSAAAALQNALYRQTLEDSALTDPLTKTFNRRGFFQKAASLTPAAPSYAIIMLDMDNLKEINDTHGHQAGDAALQTLSDILQAQIRSQDVLSRYGGDEFILLLPDVATEDARAIAHRLQAAVREAHISYGGRTITVTASMGMATPRPGDSLEACIKRADEALYQAKSRGKNCLVVA